MDFISEYLFEILLYVYLASLGFTLWLADQKTRNPLPWALLALLFGPLALIAIAGAPALEPSEEPEPSDHPWPEAGLPWLRDEDPPAPSERDL